MNSYRENRWDSKPVIHRFIVEKLSTGEWLIGTIAYDDVGATWKPLGKKETWQEAIDLVNYSISCIEHLLIKINQYN